MAKFNPGLQCMPYILSKGITLWFSWGLYLWLSPPLEEKGIQEKINNFATSLETNGTMQ